MGVISPISAGHVPGTCTRKYAYVSGTVGVNGYVRGFKSYMFPLFFCVYTDKT